MDLERFEKNNTTNKESSEENIEVKVNLIDNDCNELCKNIVEPNHTDSFQMTYCDKSKDDIKVIQVTNALSIIASTYSESEDEEESEINITHEQITIDDSKQNNYRNNTLNDDTDSEDSENSSDSSSSSSSSSDSSSDSDTDDDENRRISSKPRYSKNSANSEFDNLPPIEDLQISVPEVLCDPIGEVGWMVEQMVVVKPKPNKPTLNFDTILFIDKGKRPLGRVFDVFGPVTEPHYCVRFNSGEHIQESNIKIGMTVYYCPNTPYTTLVFMTDLLKMKASDDVGEDELPEFSDDEEEKAYYAALKAKKSNNKGSGIYKNTPIPAKRSKIQHETGWKTKHPWHSEKKNRQHKSVYQSNNSNNNLSNNGSNLYYNQQPNNPSQQIGNYYNNYWSSTFPYNYWNQNSYSSECQPVFPSTPTQSNANPTQHTSPSFSWSSSSTFPPTYQNIPWHVPPPPPPPPSS
ncbi:H/ACA ribonucleoprotein complex non-core subunit NAF1 [Chelonus insularis]|uniref:H/ACA ribonucleoprotein complex non-core subunit NAF1 n=1 Tax=Chelonus insularis TaxID=460826 RepID=UPI0015896EAE|nr:H/ACA ribonucleoprotein complex non-core subunit NAF1 [Chelonus insularis]